MTIDVAINSCGRIDILETTIQSFKKYVKYSGGEFRFIILEDRLDDKHIDRIRGRDEWLLRHKEIFDIIVFNIIKAGYIYAYRDIINIIESPIFFRLDDDTPIVEEINLDPLIDFLISKDDISQIIFSKPKHRLANNHKELLLDNRKLILNKFYSISTGLHKLSDAKKIVQLANGICHEGGTLTPTMLQLRLISSVLYGKSKDMIIDDLGTKLGYVKGRWK